MNKLNRLIAAIRAVSNLFKPTGKMILSICVLLAAFACPAYAGLPPEIRTNIQLLDSAFSPSEKLMTKVLYTNMADYEVRVLKWETVLNGRVDVDFLDIAHDGNTLAYTGRIYKRERITPSHYVTFEPGETKSVEVDLESGYDVNYEGVYEVQVKHQSLFLKQADVPQSFKLTSDRPIQFKRTPIVQGCTATQDTEVDAALSAAENIASTAKNDLQNTPVSERANARRYSEWFGTYSLSRWNKEQSNFDRILSAVSGQTLTFICDNTESAFAYVFPSQPYDIYLGAAFWRAPRTGTDSKAGTIIHELSHFNVVGGTDDHVYGQSGARSLARSNPTLASDNADSHEYFAENTPFLSMPSGASNPGSDDLSLSVIKLSKTEAFTNNTLVASGTLTNGGDSALSATKLTVYVSADNTITTADAVSGSLTIGAFAAGANEDFEINFKAPSEEGSFFVGVCASGQNATGDVVSTCSAGIALSLEKSSIISAILGLLLGD